MHIVAIHDIREAGVFWQRIQTKPVPEGARLLQVLPDQAGTKVVCLWEAPHLEQIRDLVEDTVGDVSDNELFVVNPEDARGVPG